MKANEPDDDEFISPEELDFQEYISFLEFLDSSYVILDENIDKILIEYNDIGRIRLDGEGH